MHEMQTIVTDDPVSVGAKSHTKMAERIEELGGTKNIAVDVGPDSPMGQGCGEFFPLCCERRADSIQPLQYYFG